MAGFSTGGFSGTSTGASGLGTSDAYFLSSSSSVQTRYSPGGTAAASDYLLGLGSPLAAESKPTSATSSYGYSYTSTTGYTDTYAYPATRTYSYTGGSTDLRVGFDDLDSRLLKRNGSESKLANGTSAADSFLLTTADPYRPTSTSDSRYQTTSFSDLRFASAGDFGTDDSSLLKRTHSETRLVSSSSESTKVATFGDTSGSARAFALDSSTDSPPLPKGTSSDSWLLTPASDTAADYRSGSSSYETTTRIVRTTNMSTESSKFVSDRSAASGSLLADDFDFSRYLTCGTESPTRAETSATSSSEWTSGVTGFSSSTTFQSSSESSSSFMTARTPTYE